MAEKQAVEMPVLSFDAWIASEEADGGRSPWRRIRRGSAGQAFKSWNRWCWRQVKHLPEPLRSERFSGRTSDGAMPAATKRDFGDALRVWALERRKREREVEAGGG